MSAGKALPVAPEGVMVVKDKTRKHNAVHEDTRALAGLHTRSDAHGSTEVTIQRFDEAQTEFRAKLRFEGPNSLGSNFHRLVGLSDIKRGHALEVAPSAVVEEDQRTLEFAAHGAAAQDHRGTVVDFNVDHWQLRGDNLWIEQYDWLWIAVGYGILFGLAMVTPFASVFNVQYVLWLFWGALILIYLSLRAMAYTNNNIGQRGSSFMRFPHTKLLIMLLIVTFRPVFSATYLGQWHVSLTITCLQLVALVTYWWAKPSKLVPIALAFLVLQLGEDILIAAGDHSSSSLATLDFTVSLLVVVVTYVLQAPQQLLRRYLRLGKGQFVCHYLHSRSRGISRQQSVSMTQVHEKKEKRRRENFMEGLQWIRRVAVCTTFANYVVMSPDITARTCGSAGWERQWSGWILITAVLILLSYRISPLVPRNKEQERRQQEGPGRFLGQHDEFIANLCILFANVAVVEMTRCLPITEAAKGALFFLSCVGVAFVFLVVLRWKEDYSPTRDESGARDTKVSLTEVAATLASRMFLVVMALAFLTAIVTSVGFGLATIIREYSGCHKTLAQLEDKQSHATYQHLDIALNESKRLNESLFVGLHNSYHQASPLSGVVQSWAYSHPPFSRQLDLGYREFEIDVHWRRNSFDWRVFHVLMMDQGTSCTCLVTCLMEIRQWMRDPRHRNKHTPIIVHIEPRGYKYNDLFCERSDGERRIMQLQQLVYDLFRDDIYFPANLTRGQPNALAALRGAGWPTVAELKGKILFNLNIFSSNMKCKDLYFNVNGVSSAGTLQLSRDLLGDDASVAASDDEPKRKVFFNRGTREDAERSTTTVMMEVTASEVVLNRSLLSDGFITRLRIGRKPEDGKFISTLHRLIPATLISYDGVSPG